MHAACPPQRRIPTPLFPTAPTLLHTPGAAAHLQPAAGALEAIPLQRGKLCWQRRIEHCAIVAATAVVEGQHAQRREGEQRVQRWQGAL